MTNATMEELVPFIPYLGCIRFYDSTQDSFDFLTQDCLLKALEPLLLCIPKSSG